MRMPWPLLFGACVAATAVTDARACSDQPASKAAAVAPRVTSAASLLSWKPRAWAPAGRTAAPTFQGLRVSIDPVDGAMGMPPVDELASSAVISDEAPVLITRRANGGFRAQLDDRFAEFAVVSIGADGKPHWTCVHGPAQATRFIRTPAVRVTQPVGEEK